MKRKEWAGAVCRAGLLCLLSTVMVCGLSYRVAAVNYPVNVTISTGTCSVYVSPSDPPGVNVMTSDMAAGGIHGAMAVSVWVMNCLGVGAASKVPSVRVSGMTYDQVDTASVASFPAGQYLFTSAASEAKYAGFVLSKSNSGAQAWDTNAANTYLKNNDIVPVGDAGSVCGAGAECSVVLYAGLACGEMADCATHFGSNDNDGFLSTSIAFTFLYN